MVGVVGFVALKGNGREKERTKQKTLNPTLLSPSGSSLQLLLILAKLILGYEAGKCQCFR